MGLAQAAHQLVRLYSGGMIRRLEIAQAMLHRPPVLFLDEPTVGLDPVARQDFEPASECGDGRDFSAQASSQRSAATKWFTRKLMLPAGFEPASQARKACILGRSRQRERGRYNILWPILSSPQEQLSIQGP